VPSCCDVAAFVSFTSARGQDASPLKVMISGGFRAAYQQLVPEFERKTGHTIETAYGGSMGNAPNPVLAHFRCKANRHTPFANRRMKFYPRTITETQRARLKRNSLAATRPGVRKDRLSRDVIIIIIVHPFASRDLLFATNQGAVAPIANAASPNQTRHMTWATIRFRVRPTRAALELSEARSQHARTSDA
jgi:hypothetical protein